MAKFEKERQDLIRKAVESLMCKSHKSYPKVTFDEEGEIIITACCQSHSSSLTENVNDPAMLERYLEDYVITNLYSKIIKP